MIPDLQDVYKWYLDGDDIRVDRAWSDLQLIAETNSQAVNSRADAMVMLGLIGRIIHSDRRASDNGESWLRRALALRLSDPEALLALCEIALTRNPVDIKLLEEFRPRLDALSLASDPKFSEQWRSYQELLKQRLFHDQ